ncbi:MAG: hypothetical protein ACLP1Y_12840 [Candidatus Acidiferrales bacterium]
MRMLITVRMDTEAADSAAKQGRLVSVIREQLEKFKPEVAYFTTDYGDRTGFIVMDVKEANELIAVAEPVFTGLGAKISMRPVTTAEDLPEGGGATEDAAKRAGA